MIDSKHKMGECNRCGKCCFYPISKNPDGSLVMKSCRYLIQVSKDKFHCRIFSNRLNTQIGLDFEGKPVYCNMYNSLSTEIVGCPMNIGGKPTREVIIENNKKAVQFIPIEVII